MRAVVECLLFSIYFFKNICDQFYSMKKGKND